MTTDHTNINMSINCHWNHDLTADRNVYIIITGIIITIITNITINQMQLILTCYFEINILNACHHKNEIIQSNQMLLTIKKKRN